MKKMSIRLWMMGLFFIAITSVKAQDFKVSISNPAQTKIVIKELNRVKIEAYNGSEVQIKTDSEMSKPERAKGLKALSGMGEDNTGIGLNVKESGNELTIVQVSRRGEGKYTIKVPENSRLMVEHTGNWEGGKIEIHGVKGELEVSGRYNSFYLKDITGPVLANTIYGGIEAVFSEVNQNKPISIVSVYGEVDVTIPQNTKADLKIKTPYGEAYSDLPIEFPKNESGMRNLSDIQGKMNGGGVRMDIEASYGDVYLRKK